MVEINICDDFSNTPGGRTREEGPFSGEEFRETILLPALEEAEKRNEKLKINFDNCFGFATSFLEEAFGGLVRIDKKENVFERLIIKAEEDVTIPELIKKYIKNAEKER